MERLERRVNLLSRLPMFRRLSTHELESMASIMQDVTMEPTQEICRQGDPADAVFILAMGAAEVLTQTEQGDEQQLAMLQSPSVIGELALIDGAPRSATVRAFDRVWMLAMTCERFNQLRYTWNTAAFKVIHNLSVTLCDRLRSTNERINDFFSDPEASLATMQRRQRELWQQRLRQQEEQP